MKRRLFIAASLFAMSFSPAYATEVVSFSPQPPAINAGAWVLMDYTTGQILTAGNEHQQRNPASLTKLMTGYVVDRAIDSKRISPTDIVTVGRDAWAKDNPVFVGSSLMFLKEGDRVSVRDLSRGLIVDSGNDACVALADYIAGGQPQFVAMMNNYVQKLNLRDTHFETVHGLDAPGQHSSAYDLAVLSRAIIHGEPDFYHMYSEKSLTWNGITQQNRNGLLWDKTMNVDGLKTGHTSGAGFNLIASAVDGQRRLIAVVMGAESAKGREDQARKLLEKMSGQQITVLVNYMVQAGNTQDVQTLLYKLAQRVPQHGDKLMTMADQLKQIGREEGKRIAILDIAKAMLKRGLDTDAIMEMTGLSKDELQKLVQ